MRNWIDRSLLLLTVAVTTASLLLGGCPSRPGGLLQNGLPQPGQTPSTSLSLPTESAYASTDLIILSRACGGELQEMYVTGWARISDRLATEKELQAAIGQVAGHLEPLLLEDQEADWPPGAWAISQLAGSLGVNYSRALGPDRRIEAWARSASLAVESAGVENGPGEEPRPADRGMTYLVVQITGLKDRQQLESVRRAAGEAFRQLGVEGNTSIGLVCWREGKMEAAAMSRCAGEVLAAAGAREVERLDQSELVSITAFSPSIAEGLDLDGRRVNLQVAARYHPIDRRTYFHLGIPLIMTDY